MTYPADRWKISGPFRVPAPGWRITSTADPHASASFPPAFESRVTVDHAAARKKGPSVEGAGTAPGGSDAREGRLEPWSQSLTSAASQIGRSTYFVNP